MNKERKSSAIDFVATFFVNNQTHSQLLSEILKNKDNVLFLAKLNLPSDFVLPFVREDRNGKIVYSIKHEENADYNVLLHDCLCENHVIQSGDFFTFRNRHNGQSLRVLLIAASAIAPAYKKYTLPKNANIYIGRSSANDIACDFSGYIAKDRQAVIRVDNNRALVEHLNKNVGMYVNGYFTESQQLKPYSIYKQTIYDIDVREKMALIR